MQLLLGRNQDATKATNATNATQLSPRKRNMCPETHVTLRLLLLGRAIFLSDDAAADDDDAENRTTNKMKKEADWGVCVT